MSSLITSTWKIGGRMDPPTEHQPVITGCRGTRSTSHNDQHNNKQLNVYPPFLRVTVFHVIV